MVTLGQCVAATGDTGTAEQLWHSAQDLLLGMDPEGAAIAAKLLDAV